MFERLRARYRTLRLRALQTDVFQGITPLNNDAEWLAASPDTLAFHHLIKAPLRFAVRAIRVPQHWIDRLDGNAAVLWDIIDRVYLQHERQAWRRAILEPIARFGCCLVAFDNNYTEVADAVLAAVIRERDRFAFDPTVINPDNWYQDGRGRIELGTSAPFRVLSRTAAAVVLDHRIDGRIITVTETATGRTQYLGLDLANATEPYPGIIVYPILSQGAGVLDVAPAVMGAS